VFSYIPFPKDPSNLFVGSYFFNYICTMDELSLYQQIENAIIEWSNDGTKTAGNLTREIIDIINKLK
jgi:hypothetical protein